MTTFREWDAKLQEDVQQIQMLASLHETEGEQIERIQHIAVAAAYCLAHRMGPKAAAYWLGLLSKQINARGQGHVH